MEMPIAVALVLIFVLYLIDKHKLWRKALKLVIGVVVLGILGIGGVLGWGKYQDYRDERRKEAEGAAQEAEAEAEQARISACISRLEKIPVPKDAVAAEIPSDIQITCSGDSSATTYNYHPVPPLAPGATLIPPNPKSTIDPPPQPPPNCEVVACSDWAVVVTIDNFGGTPI